MTLILCRRIRRTSLQPPDLDRVDDTVRHTQPRFDATTEHLLDTADRLVIDHGLREFSLESVSSEGFASTGSVYERWRSKWNLIDDLIEQRFEQHWETFTTAANPSSLTERLDQFQSSPEGHLLGTWMVELLHLSRVRPDHRPRTIAVLDRLGDWFGIASAASDDPALVAGVRWYAIAVTIGQHQLRIGEASLPSMSSDLAVLLSPPSTPRPATTGEGVLEEIPGTAPPTPPAIDDVSRHIVGVTRDLLASASGELSVRSILGRSKISSTTLYRRFESKRQLMLQVLNDELGAASYEWVVELVESLGSDDPIGSMAKVFRRRYDTLHDFPDTRNVILELTAQARQDSDLRRTLIGQVERMAALRAELFVRMNSAGILNPKLSPIVGGWLVQTSATGYRLLVGAGIPLDPDGVEAASARVLWNFLDN